MRMKKKKQCRPQLLQCATIGRDTPSSWSPSAIVLELTRLDGKRDAGGFPPHKTNDLNPVDWFIRASHVKSARQALISLTHEQNPPCAPRAPLSFIIASHYLHSLTYKLTRVGLSTFFSLFFLFFSGNRFAAKGSEVGDQRSGKPQLKGPRHLSRLWSL